MTKLFRYGRWPLALMIALLSLSMGWVPTSAAPGTGQNTTQGTVALEQAYKTTKVRLTQQDAALTRMGVFADKVAELITKAQAKGKDTTALAQALTTFRQQLVTARAAWQTASDTFASHAGFDAQGKVTDATIARATLKDVRSAMLNAHSILVKARTDIRQALTTFRSANRGVTTPTVPAVPAQP
ncbi:MAG: hypothetical protein WCP31_05405 [Chloroflexales bacterium]